MENESVKEDVIEKNNELDNTVIDVNEDDPYDKDENGLNSKQRHFAELYMTTGEVGKSYAISYKKKNNASASAAGSRLAKNPKVVKYISREREKILSNNRIATEEDILKFWTSTMTNPEYKVIERVKASELLAKNKGMLNDKVEITTDVVIELGFDATQAIGNKIIDQQNRRLESNEEYYDAEYEDVSEE